MAITTSYEFIIDNSYLNAATYEQLAVAAAGEFYIAGGYTAAFGTTALGVLGGSGTGSLNLPGTEIALAVLTSGNYVAVTEQGGDVYYRVRDQFHNPLTAQLNLGAINTSNPDVAALNNGGFVLVSESEFGGNLNIFLDYYNSAGVYQNGFGIYTSVSDSDASVTELAGGNVAVGWLRTLGTETEVWTAVFTQAGTFLKLPTLVDTDGEINQAVELTATTDGYAMVYRNLPSGGHGTIEVRIFDNSGNALNATVLPDIGLDFYAPSITRLSNGMLVVGYSDSVNGNTYDALIDPADLAVLALEQYPPSFGDYIFTPKVAAFGTGRFAQISADHSQAAAIISEITVRRVITGDALNNTINAQNDLSHYLIGSDGTDKLNGGTQKDELDGGNGNDTLDGKGGNDVMRGGAGNDSYFVDNFDDVIIENVGGGTDKVTSTVGSYTLFENVENLTLGSGAFDGSGNSSNNTLTGNGGQNQLFGFDGKDKLDGKGGADIMYGGNGDDIYYVDNAGDEVIEGAGTVAGKKDTVNVSYAGATYTLGDNVENGNLTGSGAQSLNGNELANTLTSKGNNNSTDHFLLGMGGKDILKGGTGREILLGGTGADMLTGGGGADFFQFEVLETSANKDTIKDFSHADDEIDFYSFAFAGLIGAAGHHLSDTLALQDMFHLGTSAGEAEDRIIYDSGTGNLWYDIDGTGTAAQILVAVLSNKPVNVDASDFFVF